MKKFLITSLLITLIGCSSETDNTSTTTDGNTSTCGDGICDADEDSSICSNDCPDISSTSISLGFSHTCSIRNGQLFCWGHNRYGQLGDRTNGTDDDHSIADKDTPIRIGDNSDWTHIALGLFHTCGFRNNGQLFCWGGNEYGQLGDGTNSTFNDSSIADKNTPIRVGNNSDWTHISLGGFHTCAIRNGQLFCWGENYEGQLGDGTNGTEDDASTANKSMPTRIGNNSDWTDITLGVYHTCALRDNGKLFCWGRNSFGQLGDGTNGTGFLDTSANKNTPTLIGNNSDWTHIVLGLYHTCGFRNNGQLFCWGGNFFGQLGDGTNDDKNTPTRIGDNFDWTHIALDGNHSCGFRNNGELFCWGWNSHGQLGDGTRTHKNTPTLIGNNSDWTHIALGKGHTCGFRNNGQLFCWGDNEFGQLGDGTNGTQDGYDIANKNTPTLIDSF